MQPLPTKLVLQKKKAKEGRSGDDVEHFPVPSRITVRRKSAVAVIENKELEEISRKHVRYSFTFLASMHTKVEKNLLSTCLLPVILASRAAFLYQKAAGLCLADKQAGFKSNC